MPAALVTAVSLHHLPPPPELLARAPEEPPAPAPRPPDLAGFYTAGGPPGGWDAAITRRSRELERGRARAAAHVIKERGGEEGAGTTRTVPRDGVGLQSTGGPGKTAQGNQNVAGKLRGGPGKLQGGPGKLQGGPGKLLGGPGKLPGGTGKALNSGGGPDKAGKDRKAAGVMSAVAARGVKLPALGPGLEEEAGPWRLQALLRRTEGGATDTLRRMKGGPPRPMGEVTTPIPPALHPLHPAPPAPQEVLRLFGTSLLPPVIATSAPEVAL